MCDVGTHAGRTLCVCLGQCLLVYSQVEQLDKLEQYSPSFSLEEPEGDGALGALSQAFYQAALQVASSV